MSKTLREKITEICEALFKHGKETPNKSYDSPKGQITIVDGIDQLLALVQQTIEEIIGEDDKENGNLSFYRNYLREDQRARLKDIIGK